MLKIKTKKNNMFTVLVINQVKFSFLFLCVLLSSLPIQSAQSQSSCQATVNSVIKEIKRKGVPGVRMQVLRSQEENQLLNPIGLNKLKIIFNNPTENSIYDSSYDSRIQDVFASKKLLKNWVITIFKACHSTGYITFQWRADTWNENINFAMKDDGRLFWVVSTFSPDFVNPDSDPWPAFESYEGWVPVLF